MTEQELRVEMQARLKLSGLRESVAKIAEMLANAYERGFRDGMDVTIRVTNAHKSQTKGE